MNIAVIATHNTTQLSKTTYEAITAAVDLNSNLKAKLSLWIVGADNSKAIKEATKLPIDLIISMENSFLKDYIPETYIDVLIQILQVHKAQIMIFPGDITGNELSVRLGARIGSQTINDCISVNYSNKELSVIKPVYSGNLLIRYLLTEEPNIISIRSGVYDGKKYIGINKGKKTKLEKFDWDSSNLKTWVRKKEVKTKFNDILTDARYVIIGGAGIGGKEGFSLLEKFAAKIGAVVGGTKSAISRTWLPIDRLVGQSGKIIAPDLCIVIGASGATPFLAGINKAKMIFAINIDENAPIFNACDIGIVDDYRPIIDRILKLL